MTRQSNVHVVHAVSLCDKVDELETKLSVLYLPDRDCIDFMDLLLQSGSATVSWYSLYPLFASPVALERLLRDLP